jgi:hypothetical protein
MISTLAKHTRSYPQFLQAYMGHCKREDSTWLELGRRSETFRHIARVGGLHGSLKQPLLLFYA